MPKKSLATRLPYHPPRLPYHPPNLHVPKPCNELGYPIYHSPKATLATTQSSMCPSLATRLPYHPPILHVSRLPYHPPVLHVSKPGNEATLPPCVLLRSSSRSWPCCVWLCLTKTEIWLGNGSSPSLLSDRGSDTSPSGTSTTSPSPSPCCLCTSRWRIGYPMKWKVGFN